MRPNTLSDKTAIERQIAATDKRAGQFIRG